MLSLENISYYRNEKVILKDISISINPQEVAHVIGDNGSGKTTLLRIACGLITPSKGVVRTNQGNSILYIGHQDSLNSNLSVVENLKLLASLKNATPIFIDNALHQFNLYDKRNLCVSQLSAGQKRRVVLCQMMTVYQTVWILDEPFVTLDVKGKKLVESLIQTHVNNNGMCLLATHQSLEFFGESKQLLL